MDVFPLKIIYEDEVLLLTVKPPGIAVESRRIGEKDMVSMVKNYRVQKGEPAYIGIVHRLDQPVGGLLLFAKTREAAAAMCRQMQDKTLEKYYQALLCGSIEDEGELIDYLRKEEKGNVSRVVEAKTPGGKRAALRFRKLGELSREETGIDAPVSLVEIRLLTGRHHQIRVQMAHHGFPLLGDRKYNTLKTYGACQGAGKWQGLALFAWKLRFQHPKTGEWMEFTESPGYQE